MTQPIIPDDATPAAAARAILDAIKANPQRHDQTSWVKLVDANGDWLCDVPHATAIDPTECGTTMCVAGWAAHLNGWTLHSDSGIATRGDNSDTHVREIGRCLLGLSRGAARHLFYETDEDAARKTLQGIADGEHPDDAVMEHVP